MSKKSKIQRKNLNRVNNSDIIAMGSADDELKKLAKILVCIIGIICVFYILTTIITKNNGGLKYVTNESMSQISYTDILASDILKKNGTYYVLVRDTEDVYVDLYDTYITSYIEKDESLPVYYVNLNDAMNQKYKGTENNFTASDLKFKETCLLKIVDGRVDGSYEDMDAISEHLKSLTISE